MLVHASAAIEDFAGGTQLGVSLASLRHLHARRLVGRRTIVLVITDGLDTGEPADLANELAWLCRRSRRLLWLNPLLRFDGYAPLARGASVLHAHAHGMLAVHNLRSAESDHVFFIPTTTATTKGFFDGHARKPPTGRHATAGLGRVERPRRT
jgi:uncharacterized protein